MRKIYNAEHFEDLLDNHHDGYARYGYFIANNGDVFSMEGAEELRDDIIDDWENKSDDEYTDGLIVSFDINWEDTDLYCEHTGKQIETAYDIE